MEDNKEEIEFQEIQFEILNLMSKDELEELMNDDEAIDDLAYRNQCLNKVLDERIEICQVNYDLAQENINKKPDLQKAKDKLISLVDDYNTMKLTLDEQTLKYNALQEGYSPENIKNLLLAKIKNIEKESDSYSSMYYKGEIHTDEFSVKFLQIRKKFQNYKILSNRLKLNLNS